ncbi:hypothetical protein PRIO_1803 [Paenibacillus riograndensis SBR5]|uniref:Uncharacterized protein n=1 Tax=Paenibacillus riograndensis SBR5 TaxID=1073571 RepID=A0A0E3WGV8_9BACL|nr:hypothetical protein PRIO_1803 [Paenibacillus riograndensis SBR5]
MVNRADFAWLLWDIMGSLTDLSVSDPDRKSAIWGGPGYSEVKRTEIPLFHGSPLIPGSNERYNGS